MGLAIEDIGGVLVVTATIERPGIAVEPSARACRSIEERKCPNASNDSLIGSRSFQTNCTFVLDRARTGLSPIARQRLLAYLPRPPGSSGRFSGA
jgi:hypothetical protein